MFVLEWHYDIVSWAGLVYRSGVHSSVSSINSMRCFAVCDVIVCQEYFLSLTVCLERVMSPRLAYSGTASGFLQWIDITLVNSYIHTHTRLTALFPGLPGWASTRKVKPIWILLKQETVSGSGISWALYKCAPRSRQITMPAPHHLVFYRPDALPAVQPTASKHWRHDNSC